MDWYKRWFGEEYLFVYEHRNLSEAELEIETIKSILELKENELILDLCCGPGRHDLPLTLLGCRVIGLDYSMPLLQLARKNRPPDKTFPLYVRGDARHIPFCDNAFDAVLNLFTSFGYFSDEDNRGFINSIARILKPGGRYYIDYLNPSRVISELVEESTREKNGIKIIEKRQINHTTSRIEKIIILQQDKHLQTFQESVRLYEPDEMFGMFRDAGLNNTTILGSARGEPYCKTSERMIFYGHKA